VGVAGCEALPYQQRFTGSNLTFYLDEFALRIQRGNVGEADRLPPPILTQLNIEGYNNLGKAEQSCKSRRKPGFLIF
jgi:hypothetical protein